MIGMRESELTLSSFFCFCSVPRAASGNTYLYAPQDQLRSLFDSFDLDFPESLTRPLDMTNMLIENDTVPAGVDLQKTSAASELVFFVNMNVVGLHN